MGNAPDVEVRSGAQPLAAVDNVELVGCHVRDKFSCACEAS